MRMTEHSQVYDRQRHDEDDSPGVFLWNTQTFSKLRLIGQTLLSE
jgi:hypothetical protein